MQPGVADWCWVSGCGRAFCVCVCVAEVVVRSVVVEASVVRPARQAAVELACGCEVGDFEKGTHTTTNLPPLTRHQTLPLNSCLRLPSAVGPRQGQLLLFAIHFDWKILVKYYETRVLTLANLNPDNL